MHIRPIDMSDVDEFGRCYAILREAELFERPEAPMWSERELSVRFSRDDPAEKITPYGAFDGDSLVAAGFIALNLLANVDLANLHVAVPPRLRRQRIGSTVLTDLVARSRDVGRTVMLGEVWLPLEHRGNHPYRSFAEKNGFELAHVETRRVLRLPVPTDQLRAWAEEAAPHHRDYTIRTYVDDIPDELLDSYLHVRNQLPLEAPTGDIELEAGAMTREAHHERQAIATAQGRTTFHALAVDSNGEAVAYTSMSVASDEPRYIQQWGTLVRRDHRGHRLGMAVKVANIAAVQSACPGRTLINTTNAETNGPMVAINDRLGFRPVDELAEFQRFLSSPTSGDSSLSEQTGTVPA